MNARKLTWGAVLALAAASIALPAGASAGGHHHTKRVTCHGPSSLDGFFQLSGTAKVKGKRTDCGTARNVVKRFPDSCSGAYAGQGRCKIPASGRWKCRSRIVGGLEDGAPSKEKCKHRRSKLKFTVAYFPPTEPTDFNPPAGGLAPYDQQKRCVDTSKPGQVLTPPNPSAAGNFEVHLFGGVSPTLGQAVQSSLVNHKVSPVLHAGLDSQPRNDPKRIPIFLTPGDFDSDQNRGIAAQTCSNRNVNAIVVAADHPSAEVASIAAHELFHAYAYWGIANGIVKVPWWEEASATWSEGRTGYPEVEMWDNSLQYPNFALDADTPKTYKYAMSRFVQFLDFFGYIGKTEWPLQRAVIGKYAGGATDALAARLASFGTTLGEQAARFWGDRLRETPLYGKQLRPGSNASQITVKPGTKVITTEADRLHTRFLDFTLDPNVERVELEFEPPEMGYFWGATAPERAERFDDGDSVTFCVSGPGEAGDLKWPPMTTQGRKHFPVTFTNGRLEKGIIKGKITVHATTDAGHCQPPTPDNRACHLLRDANVETLLGSGSFPFERQDQDSESKTWICFYTGNSGEVDLNLIRALKLSANQVRKNAKKQIEQLGLQRLDGVGDIAGIGKDTAQGKTYNIVVFAVGREVALFTLSPADGSKAKTLAKRLAGQID